MKTTKILLTTGLVALTALSLGVAWQQYWRAARYAAMLTGRDDSADLQKRLADAERRNRLLEAQLDARREAAGETAADEATAAAPAARDGGRGSGRGGPPAAVRAMMERPEMQRLRTLQQKAALDSRYAPLFKSLNLDAAELDRFKSLLAEREATMQDVMMAARDQGIDPRSDPEAFRKLVASAQSEIDTQLKSLLGDEAYAQYEQYAKTGPQRATVEQLRQSLSYTSDPLSDTQAAQLVSILAATSPASTDGTPPVAPPEGGRGGRGPGGGGAGGGIASAPITTAAVAQAQTVLTTTQVQALQQMQTLQQAQQQAMQAMRAAETSTATGTGNTASAQGNRGRS